MHRALDVLRKAGRPIPTFSPRSSTSLPIEEALEELADTDRKSYDIIQMRVLARPRVPISDVAAELGIKPTEVAVYKATQRAMELLEGILLRLRAEGE